MNRNEILELLRDPEFCKEIFEIVRRGGKPAPEPPAINSAPNPVQAVTTSKVREEFLALRQKMWQKVAEQKKKVTEQNLTLGENPEPPKKTEERNSLADKLRFLKSHAKKVEDEKRAQEEAEAAKVAENPDAAIAQKHTLVIERKCPVCEEQTRIVKTKSRLTAVKTDLDFYVHFPDFNPYLYDVLVCEHCGYAAEEWKFLKPMPKKTQTALLNFLHENDLHIPFLEVRTAEEALQMYDMAIIFSELFEPSSGRQAGLYLKKAWIHRYEDEPEGEHECLEKAAELYEISLNEERWPIGKISDDTALYLLGAIRFMLGDLDKATVNISRIIGNQRLRISAPKIYKKARYVWEEIKLTKQAAEKNESPAKVDE